MSERKLKIALAGNPNCGKTTVFNRLTGSNQYVGNWSGVTVEKKEGFLKGENNAVVTDLPGIYSLSPYTKEEIITRDYIINEKPDVILNVLDSSNIERNLYLTLQLSETGVPVVLMLNMIDSAEKKGIIIDEKKLSSLLGLQVVKASALKGKGVKEAAEVSIKVAVDSENSAKKNSGFFPSETEKALKRIEDIIKGKTEEKYLRWHAVKLFERDGEAVRALNLSADISQRIETEIKRCEKLYGESSEEIIIGRRYAYVEKIASECVAKAKSAPSAAEKADKILTGRFTALPVFAAIMTLVYFLSAGPVGAALSVAVKELLTVSLGGAVSNWLGSMDCALWLKSLVVDGIIGGVGAVVSFLPQLALLFLMLSLLEDCGYMARIAFIMDRFFRFFGLSGKSFIPMLIAAGCGVPAIMSSRTVDSEAQRKMTILTSTFMPCGAKLPLIALISTVFFNGNWWIAPICYFSGIAAVLLSGLLLKKTRLFKSCDAPFIMELPDYRLPLPKNILKTLWDRCGSFLKRAGTTVFLASVAVWFLSNFGISGGRLAPVLYYGDSILFGVGKTVAVIFEPLGFGNWQCAVATIMGLLAKEEIVGVFGVIADSGNGITSLFGSSLGAFSFLMFNLLCTPCIAAVSTMRKELDNVWQWLFMISYQTGFAYLVCFCIYNIGGLFIAA